MIIKYQVPKQKSCNAHIENSNLPSTTTDNPNLGEWNKLRRFNNKVNNNYINNPSY